MEKQHINAPILAIERQVEMMDNSVNQNSLNPTHICRRCGRKLKSEESKQRGFGDVCFQKWLAEGGHKKLFSISSLQKTEESV